jgi:molecular chaperone HtpG
VFQSLADAFEKDKEKLALYTQLLYNQALLIEGLPIEDPSPFQTICAKS